MGRLLIIGAGEHGYCCFEIAQRMKCYDEISFLDDKKYLLNDMVVGKISDLEKFRSEYDSCFIAIGNNKVRKELYLKSKCLGYKMATLIDPMSFVSEYCHIGEGSVVFPCAVLEACSDVSNGCIIGSNTTINHDASVDEFVLIYSNTVVRPRAHIGEMTVIESRCLISANISIRNNSHIFEGRVVDNNKEYAYKENMQNV